MPPSDDLTSLPAVSFHFPMADIAPIIQSLSSVGWVIFAFYCVIKFRPEIIKLINRLRRGKLFGQEFELEEELSKLDAAVKVVEQETSEWPTDPIVYDSQASGIDIVIGKILDQATASPKLALLSLQAEIDKTIRRALAVRGALRNEWLPSSRALTQLFQYGLSPSIANSLKLFSEVRNRIAHSLHVTDEEILQAISSGISILRSIDGLPHEINIVYHPGVDVFFDSACTEIIPEIKGLILESSSPDGSKFLRVFPTVQTYYVKGKEVTWEWSSIRIWPAAWYRDPDTGTIKAAWTGSMEFAGRLIDDIS